MSVQSTELKVPAEFCAGTASNMGEACKLIAENFGNKPLLCHAPAVVSSCGVSVSTIQNWLLSAAPRAPGYGMIRDGQEIPMGDISDTRRIRKVPVSGIPSASKINARLEEGYTLILTNPEIWCPDLNNFTAAFAGRFNAEASTTCIVSPPNSAAFPEHVDPEHVMVLQLAGRKRWEVRTAESESSLSLIISPGQILYLPPSMPHRVTGVDVGSAHLTIGLKFESLAVAVSRYVRESVMSQIPYAEEFSAAELKSAILDLASQLQDRALNDNWQEGAECPKASSKSGVTGGTTGASLMRILKLAEDA